MFDRSDCCLHSYPLRAGGFGPGRRECIRSASGAVRLIRLLGEGEEGRIRMALAANSGQWTDQDNRLKAAIRGLRAEARGDRLWLAAGAGKAAGPAPRLADEHLVGIADLH
jgi:hypothetical protein